MKEHKCQFCGRTDSLNFIEELGISVCSDCWEAVAIIVQKMMSAIFQKMLREELTNVRA